MSISNRTHWRRAFAFDEPIAVERATHPCAFTYDNTESRPINPSATATVCGGPRRTYEKRLLMLTVAQKMRRPHAAARATLFGAAAGDEYRDWWN